MGRSLSVHFDDVVVPLDQAKAAAHAVGCRLNDAFLAATVAGLRHYHEEVGQPVDHLRLSMPINLRSADDGDATGNNFAPARFPIPSGSPTRSRPWSPSTTWSPSSERSRRSPWRQPMARLLNRLPTSVTTGLFGAMLKGVDLVASNVPGAPIPIFTAGSEIRSMFASSSGRRRGPT